MLPGSVYSIVHQVYVPGTKVYRIDIPGGPDNGRAVSQLFTVQVTPAPGVRTDTGGAGQLVAAGRGPDDGLGSGNTARKPE